MAKVGRYCKAYSLSELRRFASWSETAAAPPADDSVVFLQENYVVTNGVFSDEEIIFDSVTPQWQLYCREVLGFAIPEDLGESSQAAGPQ